jgi:hypothetical protein
MEDYLPYEPLPLTDFIVARGRALAERLAAGAPLAIAVSVEGARRLWPELEDALGRSVTIDPYGSIRP